MVRLGTALVATVLIGACSGQTLEGDPFFRGVGGSAPTAGKGGGGTAGSSAGSSTGGMGGGATGGAGGATGGVGTGGTPMMGGSGGTTGGTGGMPMVGGSGGTTGGTGGMPMMGGSGGTSATGGSGGSAGEGICELPLETGPCNALFYNYGFDASVGHCVRFVYGGCSGNENRFETLGECEAGCGGSELAGCPDMMPSAECEPLEQPCYYTVAGGCLCVPARDGIGCSQIDPNCPQTLLECVGDDCVGRIVGVTRNRCECSGGAWACTPG